MRVRLNTTYASSSVGSGTYTRNMLLALPGAQEFRLPAALTRPRPIPFWTKRLVEELFSIAPGTTIHPYWAASCSSGDVVSALDLVQYREATVVERQMLRRSVRSARAVLALSAAAALEVEAELGRRCVVAHPFPDAAWYRPSLGLREKPSRQIRLAYWGGWHKRKGISAFLEALSRSRIAPDVEVVLVGRAPQVLGLQVERHPVVAVNALVAIAESCDLSVYPSQEEGFGLPVFESLLRGVPVITRSLPVYDEFVAASPAHIRLESNEPAEVAQAVEDAIAGDVPPVASLLKWTTRDQALALIKDSLRKALST